MSLPMQPPRKRTYTLQEIMAMSGLSWNTVRRLVDSGQLEKAAEIVTDPDPLVLHGTRVLVTARSVEQLFPRAWEA